MKYLILFVCLFVLVKIYAQNEDFASDRPGLSDAPDLIDKNSWQISSGFDLSKYNHYGLIQPLTSTLKYGISKRFEARMDFNLQYDKIQKVFGTSSPSFGLKTLLINQSKAIPKIAFIIEYYPPPFGSAQQPSGLGTELCFSHNFKSGNNLYYNLGSNWQDLKVNPTLNSLLGFSYEWSEKISTFVEFYLYKKPKVILNYVAGIGLTYLINKKLQADFAFGLDLVNPNGNFYFDGGITYNF